MTDEEKRTKNAEKSRKRREQLQYAAELNGFETWSEMMTYIKNEAQEGRCVIQQKCERCGNVMQDVGWAVKCKVCDE